LAASGARSARSAVEEVCKACANCPHAHPFIKSSQVPAVFQSISASHFSERFFCTGARVSFEQRMLKQRAGIIASSVTNKF
jgi:hypothetical protein